MADASFVQTSFLGGEWSPLSQGRFDDPTYRTAMNVSLNMISIEAGASTRRPGTHCDGTTRNGNPGRVIAYNFTDANPYNMEFTDNFLRFWASQSLAMTNDANTVSAISTANPAVVTTAKVHGWSTGNQVQFGLLQTTAPLLQNRLFLITVLSTTTFSIADPITGANIDGSTLGYSAPTPVPSVQRVLEVATPYSAQAWQNVRSVQADGSSALLHATIAPQVLMVTAQQTSLSFATFALTPAIFKDGPYLDPVAGGALVTPSALNGIVNLTISFNTYDSTVAYAVGSFVTYSGVNYIAITDGNQNLQPDTHSSNWTAIGAGIAVGPNGLQATDIGRLVRLFSEPPLWAIGTAYTTGNSVTYNSVYYTAAASTTGNQPDISPTKWTINPTGAVWTWGKITALTNIIDRALASSVAIGNFTGSGGLAAAFDGITNQASAASASVNSGTTVGPNTNPIFGFSGRYVGKDYHSASAQKIAWATVFPSSDLSFAQWSAFDVVNGFNATGGPDALVFNLRAKATSPASSSDGTLLGTVTLAGNQATPVTIFSNDTSTAWNYVWVEVSATKGLSGQFEDYFMLGFIAEVQFFNPTGTGVSSGMSVQILGTNLLYTTPVRIWRLGAFSQTTGYPTCGTYHEGRIWFSGAIKNRIDASVSNGFVGNTIDMTPTSPYGVVSTANGFSYPFNAPDINTVRWMQPDLQGIICGTQAGEWLVQASALNSPLSASNIQAHRVTKIGCANIEPRRTEHTIVFVQKLQRKAMEYFADVYSGKFSAPNLSADAKHLTIPGIAELAYQQELAPIIWARCNDGSLIGCTYKRTNLTTAKGPDFAAWTRANLGSSRAVESICVGRSQSGNLDALAMVTNDPDTGIRHVETMTNLFDESGTMASAWFVDDAIVPSFTQNVTIGGVPSFQLSGLWPLNGYTVSVWAGGLDCGDALVTNGQCAVPFGGSFTAAYVAAYPGTMPVLAGFTYTSDGQILRPGTQVESGSRNGPALGKVGREHGCAFLLSKTQGISVGTDFTLPKQLRPAKLRTVGDTPIPLTQLYSGVYWDSMDDAYGLTSMICWRITRPYPATVVSLAGFVHTQDK